MSGITLHADTIDGMIALASEFLGRMGALENGVSAAALNAANGEAEKAKRSRKTKATDVADPLPVPTELPPVGGIVTGNGVVGPADPFAGAAADPFASTAAVQTMTDPFAGAVAQTPAASPFGGAQPFAATAMQAMAVPQFATDALAKLDALAAVHTPEAVYVSWASKQIGLSPSSTVADVKAQILKTDEATLAALLKSAGV